MNNKLIAAIVLALSFLGMQTIFAASEQKMAQNCNCCIDSMKHLVQSLKLDDAQKTKIQALREQMKASIQANEQQMEEISDKVHSLVQSDKIDEAQLTQLIDQKMAILAKIIKEKVMAKNTIYTMLTEQQKLKFQTLMKQWKEKRAAMYKSCD